MTKLVRTELGLEDLSRSLFVDKLIEVLVDSGGEQVWRTAIVQGIKSTTEMIGVAVYKTGNEYFEFEFAWRGFNHDPKVRFIADSKRIPTNDIRPTRFQP